MAVRKTRIQLDCGEMPPRCGFECGACIQEIKDALDALDGVLGFAQHLDGLIEVAHDPEKVTVERILEAVSQLPSSHEGTFRATPVGE